MSKKKGVYNVPAGYIDAAWKYLRVIETGGGDPVRASREQWNDATNCLALAPGKVVSYNRNTASNEALRERGIQVLEISGKELGRGRGGPRCMANPLLRIC